MRGRAFYPTALHHSWQLFVKPVLIDPEEKISQQSPPFLIITAEEQYTVMHGRALLKHYLHILPFPNVMALVNFLDPIKWCIWVASCCQKHLVSKYWQSAVYNSILSQIPQWLKTFLTWTWGKRKALSISKSIY